MTAGWTTISSAHLKAQIDPQGAQLSVLRDAGGRDLLWNGDAAVWAGRAPLLFPIVGSLNGGSYRLGTQRYTLSRHGFARGSLFEQIDSTTSTATLRLSADAATLAVYPFQFELTVHFAIHASALSVTTTVRNPGNETLLASVGYHPGLRWPLPYGAPRAAHSIRFETDEPAPMRRIDAAGLLTSEAHPSPINARRLSLADGLFAHDVMIFDRIRSRSVVYGADTGPKLRIDFPDAPYLGIWSKPAAPFVCIEPWHGLTDPVGFAGDFSTKPGICRIEPGTMLSTTMSISLED